MTCEVVIEDFIEVDRSSDNTLYFSQVIAATRFVRNIQPSNVQLWLVAGDPGGYHFERAQ